MLLRAYRDKCHRWHKHFVYMSFLRLRTSSVRPRMVPKSAHKAARAVLSVIHGTNNYSNCQTTSRPSMMRKHTFGSSLDVRTMFCV